MSTKRLPKSIRCPDDCGRMIRVFLSKDGALAQYECPACAHAETRHR